MKQTLTLLNRSFRAVVAACLTAGISAQAAVVSVNFIQNSGNDAQQIDSDETFGIVSQGTVVGGWLNVNAGGSSITDSAGNPTTISLLSVQQPNGQATFNAAFSDTPLFAGFDDYTTTATPTSFTISNLNANFPNGYKVIVYVGGFLTCTNASISDGTTTYYYRAVNTAVAATNAVTAGFSRTTQTSNLGGGNNPTAQYAVFGDPTLMTSDVKTFTIDVTVGGGAGLCGFQIVGDSALDIAARTWRGNVNSDWDTATLNWTNSVVGTTNYADGDPVFFTDVAVAANPSVNLTVTRSPGSVTVDSTKNYTLTGSGIAGSSTLTKRGTGSLTLSNPNTYTGNTVISVGTLQLGASGVIPNGSGAGDVSVASGATLNLNGNNEGINGLTGAGTVDNTGAAATLTVGLDNDGGTFSGVLQGALGLNKQGTNTLTLTGSSSHTGATIAGQGTLLLRPLSGLSSSSAIVVSNGATLEATYTNGVGIFSSSTISLNGGTGLTINFGDASVTGFGTPISTSGALNLNGVTQIGIKGFNFGTGTFTLITYGSKTGAGSISSTPASLPNGMSATIQDTGSAINLVVTVPSIQNLLWTQGDGEWSTNGFFNWNLGTATYAEYPSGFGDSVSFDNSNFGTVTLPHDVKPFSVVAAGNYIVTGNGRITGSTGIDRTGFTATTFILDTTNTYTGVTTISGGTLQINRPGALGSTAAGTVVTSGGSLSLSNGITLSGEPLTLSGNGVPPNNDGALRTVDTNSVITVASPITLAADARIRVGNFGQMIVNSPVTDSGSNYTLFLHADQTNTVLTINSRSNTIGNLTIYGNTIYRGLVVFGTNNVAPAASLSIGGGLFDLNAKSQIFAGLLGGFNPTLGVVTNSSATASTITINYSGTNSAQAQSALQGLVNIVKEGTGVQSFGGGSAVKHTYSGTTIINGGVFGVASDFSGATNQFIVNSGGALRGSGNTIGGPVTVNAGGKFYAGFSENQVGELTVSNSLTLAGNVIAAINKDASPSNDVINVSGPLTYGGTLTITNLGTNTLVVGDTFRVFRTGGTGSFTIVNPANATFSFSDGLLTVTSVTFGQPTLNVTQPSSGVLQFSWSGAFKLQSQTNSLSTGLSNNWSDYPGGGSSPVNVNINPANPSVFFRLQSL